MIFLLLFCQSTLMPAGIAHGLTVDPIRQSVQEAGNGLNQKEVRSLEPGKPVRRELAGWQRHSYRIKLSAGQFLKVMLGQQGIDVVVQVSGPDGKQLFEYDSESRPQGQEEVSLVAEAAGDYRLIVLPAQHVSQAGRYEIRIGELRAATDTDRALHDARKQYEESRELLRAGEYGKALSLVERALEIRERVLGTEDRDVAITIDDLAGIYAGIGEYAKAESLHKRALEICEKSLGRDHPFTAESLDNLALLYASQGKYADAEPLCRRALEIREKALGKEHQKTATSLHNLAVLYVSQRKYREAESLYRRALGIREKVLGKDHPDTAISLNTLAALYRTQGKYAEAESLFKRALEIREKTLGKDHPYTAIDLNDLAMLYTAEGNIVQAIKYQSRANTATEHNLALNLAAGSERQKLAYLALSSNQTDFTLSLHSRYAPDDPEALDLAFTTLLRRKGRGLDAMTDTIAALRRHSTPENQKLFDQLAEARSQFAGLVLRGPQKMTIDEYRNRIKALEERVEQDEADVSRRSSEFRAQSQPVTLEAVRAAIPPDAALIEFASYRPFNAKATKDGESFGQSHYVAYVLRREGEIRWRELGEAQAIDLAVAALLKALRDPRRGDVKLLARFVDAKIIQPLRPLLGDLSRLLISPDGSLNLIPFGALVDENGRYLVESYSISYLTSGRDLLRLQVVGESRSGPLVVAAPDFGSRVESARLSESAASAFDEFYFPPLPYAAQEGEALHALLPGSTLLTRRQATKAALFQIRSPRLLHIATHGFFLEERQLAPPGGGGRRSLTGDQGRLLQHDRHGVYTENPLLRSGLALAGANEHKEDDNGILTALEAAGLNLWGTKLVVFSAADTGVGEVKNGEGVYGLRRSLVLAGAETQVMSLWAVSDRATKDLMVSYYRMLQEGEGRGDALRQVQLEMLKNVNRRHPYYWASFIQSGEWANLDGKR